jgi:hypothetical protein
MKSIIIVFAILLKSTYEMKRSWFHLAIFSILTILFSNWTFFASAPNVVLAQQPTNVPSGMFVTVITEEPQINVRMGPSSSIYPIVGVMLRGETAPALGRSQGGDWIQIEFPGAPNNKGWVYSPLVRVSSGILQIAEPPPTPLQPPTPTIDPTLAAQFNVIPTSTRLPTFTPPPSLNTPSFTQTSSTNSFVSVPLAAVILAFVVLGIIGFLLSLVSRR